MNVEDIDLTALITEVCEESRMIYPGREWKLDAPEPVPARGDQDMLKQTARILVDNAVKYTSDGSRVTLRVRSKDGAPCFEVQDNGIGIPEKDLSHIFDRFFRADPARSRATGGTGLGLSIAKWIVEKHGGYFDVFSREEIGTRIGVVLPRPDREQE
jgi:signal transduction histidine kinase